MTVKQETCGSIPQNIIETILKIKKPTVRQELIIGTLTQTSSPELGPILAEELTKTVEEEKPSK